MTWDEKASLSAALIFLPFFTSALLLLVILDESTFDWMDHLR